MTTPPPVRAVMCAPWLSQQCEVIPVSGNNVDHTIVDVRMTRISVPYARAQRAHVRRTAICALDSTRLSEAV
ncbi:MAG: hypothetical protein ACRENI_07365 [Gemmatimonadaceae bacterium]